VTRTATVLFLVATSVIAFHAADHLSALAPIALQALAAAMFPCMSGAGRSVTALLAGIIGIATGFEAGAYLCPVGPSGDDYSGLASLAAGIVLIGLGLVTRQRTLRTDPSRRKCRIALDRASRPALPRTAASHWLANPVSPRAAPVEKQVSRSVPT
jgi:hypothetical protein